MIAPLMRSLSPASPRRSLAVLLLAVLLGASGAATANGIGGRIVSRYYEPAGDDGYGNFIILAKTSKTIFTVTPDENGEFRFSDLGATKVVEIAWDQVAAGEYILWPLWRPYEAEVQSYEFEVKSLEDLQKLGKVAIASELEEGDMRGADRILDRVLNLYAALSEEVRSSHRIDWYEYVLLRDVINTSARRRDVLGRSKVPPEMIETERKWHRQLLTQLSEPPEQESGFNRVKRGIIAAANWSQFSRKAYRPEEKRWPALSISAAGDAQEALFLDDENGAARRYRNWMLEDTLLVRDFLRDATLRALVDRRASQFDAVPGGAILPALESIVSGEAGDIRLDRFIALIDALRALIRLPEPADTAADPATGAAAAATAAQDDPKESSPGAVAP